MRWQPPINYTQDMFFSQSHPSPTTGKRQIGKGKLLDTSVPNQLHRQPTTVWQTNWSEDFSFDLRRDDMHLKALEEKTGRTSALASHSLQKALILVFFLCKSVTMDRVSLMGGVRCRQLAGRLDRRGPETVDGGVLTSSMRTWSCSWKQFWPSSVHFLFWTISRFLINI
jgi:hypothetical protein